MIILHYFPILLKYYRKNIENAGNTLPNFFQSFNYTFLSYFSILCLRYHNHKRLQISRNFSSFCNLVKFIFRGKVFNYPSSIFQIILQIFHYTSRANGDLGCYKGDHSIKEALVIHFSHSGHPTFSWSPCSLTKSCSRYQVREGIIPELLSEENY